MYVHCTVAFSLSSPALAFPFSICPLSPFCFHSLHVYSLHNPSSHRPNAHAFQWSTRLKSFRIDESCDLRYHPSVVFHRAFRGVFQWSTRLRRRLTSSLTLEDFQISVFIRTSETAAPSQHEWVVEFTLSRRIDGQK